MMMMMMMSLFLFLMMKCKRTNEFCLSAIYIEIPKAGWLDPARLRIHNPYQTFFVLKKKNLKIVVIEKYFVLSFV